jgi:DeoR family transcriptional regulator of aga operon
VDVARLCNKLGCSEATIRRDLEYLQRSGRIRRTHGGALLDSSSEPPFRTKLGTMAEAKRRIAQVAAGLIAEGDAIGLTGGTTTLQVARALALQSGLTVVTNAINIAMELASSDVRVIVTGGELRGQTFELVGPLAEPTATQIHLDRIFVGVDGLSVEGGLTTHNPTEARINRVLIDRASVVVVVADHTKIRRKTFAQIAPINLVSVVITDSEIEDDARLDFESVGIRVITA